MADPLADVLNRVGTDPQTAQPAQPHWTKQLANALGAVAQYGNPVTAPIAYAKELLDGTFVQNERERVGQLSRIPADVVSGALSLPSLPNTIGRAFGGDNSWLARHTIEFENLNEAAENVNKVGKNVGEAIAGKPLTDSFIEGTPAELGASWSRLIAGAAIPISGSWQAKLSSGLQKVSAGNAAVDAIASGAVKTMEVLTPLTLNPKAAALNIGVASALAPTLEMVVANHEQAKADIKAGSEQTKGAIDVAAQGAQEVRDAATLKTVQAGMLPGITGDDTTDAVIGAGLLGTTILAQMKYNIAGRMLNGTKKALTSYDPNNPLDKTNMGWYDLIQQQATNRNQTPETAIRKVLESQGVPQNVVEQRVTAIKESNAMRTGASVDTRLRSFITEGELPDSVHRAGPLNDLYVRLGELDPLKQEKLRYAIISQMEIDNRRVGGSAIHLFNTADADLRAYVQAAKSDPATAQIFDDAFATTRVLHNYMGEQARMSAVELREFQRLHPNFMPTTITAKGGRWLSNEKSGRFTGLETFDELGDPMKLLPQYVDEVVRSTEGQKIRRDFFTEFMQAKGRNDPYARDMIGRTLVTEPPDSSEGKFVHWRNARGENRWTEVHDAAVRNSLKDATNPSALQMHKGLGTAARWYEQGAVGTAAALTGNIFAPKSYLYARTFGSVFRPEGIATSPLDKLVQHLSSGKFGAPEPFTALPQDIFNMVNGVAAVFYQRGAMALRNGVIRAQSGGRNSLSVLPGVTMGPHTAQAAADGLTTLYKRTGAYELQQRGLLGPGTFGSVDPALSYRRAETVLRSNGLLGATKEGVTFVSDILHAITSAPAVTTLQLNRGAGKAKVSNAIRTMSGDPGASGAFRNAAGLAKTVNTVPWGNIFLQSGFRMINGFKKNPTGAVAGIMSTAIFPEVASGLWNATLGPEFSDYQYTRRSPDLQASSVYIGIPGRLPEEGVEIPIDPWLRPFKHMGGLLFASHAGLLDGTFFSKDNGVIQKAAADAVWHRQLGFSDGTVPRAIFDQTFSPPVPGPLVALGSLGGLDVKSWTNVRQKNDKNTTGFGEGTGPKGNMFLENHGWGVLDDLMRGVFAQSGGNVYTMLDETLTRRFSGDMGRNESNQSWKESAKQGVTANIAQKLKDSGRMFGTGSLFDSTLAISPSAEAAGVLVKEKLDGLRKLQEAYAASTLPGGTQQTVIGDKKRGYQQYPGVGPLTGQDQTMDVIGREATRIYRELSTAYGGIKGDMFTKRQSIANSSQYSPQLKRYLMNEIADDIIQLDRRMLTDIERHEAVISQQLGVPVKFDRPNLNKGSKQFK